MTSGPEVIAALVVTHNRVAQVEATVRRLLDEPLDWVVVVDNASTDGTVPRLRALTDARLRLIETGRNLGGAGGFELGLRRITAELDPDWVVLMDDDARPEPGAIARFRALDRTGWEAVAAAVRYPDGRICEMNRPSVNPFWNLGAFAGAARRGRAGFHLPDAAYAAERPLPVDAASFVGLFLARAAVRRAGYPEGRLFLYGDDVLYTLGLRRAGGRIAFMPAVRFEHDCATLGDDGPRVYRPLWRAYYNYRNGIIAYRAAAGGWLWPLLPLIVARWVRFAPAYGPEAPAFRRLLRLAVRDGLARRLDRPHEEILARAAPSEPRRRLARARRAG